MQLSDADKDATINNQGPKRSTKLLLKNGKMRIKQLCRIVHDPVPKVHGTGNCRRASTWRSLTS
eukprot:3300422-Rhodomonas_salina.1